MLSERKRKIIKAVVEEYVESATPVSSKAIQEEYFADISAATIRNELKTLEDMGYLLQPHTSSGRVPSSIAYEFCADLIISEFAGGSEQIEEMEEYFNRDFAGIEQVLDTCVRAISEVTNYTSVAKITKSEKLKTLKLVGLSPASAILVLVSDGGKVENSTITGCDLDNAEMIARAESILCEAFCGKEISQLIESQNEVIERFKAYEELIRKVFEAIKKSKREKENLLLSGESKIFSHKEFSDINHVKDFVELISEKEKLKNILEVDGKVEFNITIGNGENGLSEDCAVVSASVMQQGQQIARYGVIGPARMNYNKVLSVLKGVGELIGEAYIVEQAEEIKEIEQKEESARE